ncbi:hypothetical protein CEXT_77561 [Caerostris extrusa]|uniref:Uncharacterized protein n=1 Tax=Caerostris extrusa TaxID=172846 RepID=A0AAV4N609_CAEEX|nr:hypothetical protein CEXT_77561 [Caerostris extrusa]
MSSNNARGQPALIEVNVYRNVRLDFGLDSPSCPRWRFLSSSRETAETIRNSNTNSKRLSEIPRFEVAGCIHLLLTDCRSNPDEFEQRTGTTCSN